MEYKLVILDYETSSVDIYFINDLIDESDYYDYIKNLGHDPDECYWMVSSELNINIH